MGKGIAKSVRLSLGVELRKQVHVQGGTDEDLILVLQEAPDFIASLAKQLIEKARAIRVDWDGFRILNPKIAIGFPALKRPTLGEIQGSLSYIRSIERDDSTEESVVLKLATVLASTESFVSGNVYERRLVSLRSTGKLLGFQHREWLLEHQKDYPTLMALLGKVYIDFPGLVVVNGCGNHHVPCVRGHGTQFVGCWDWIARGFDGYGRFAFSSK